MVFKETACINEQVMVLKNLGAVEVDIRTKIPKCCFRYEIIIKFIKHISIE